MQASVKRPQCHASCLFLSDMRWLLPAGPDSKAPTCREVLILSHLSQARLGGSLQSDPDKSTKGRTREATQEQRPLRSRAAAIRGAKPKTQDARRQDSRDDTQQVARDNLSGLAHCKVPERLPWQW